MDFDGLVGDDVTFVVVEARGRSGVQAREYGGQGQGALPSPAAGPDRAGRWTGTEKAATPDRARQSAGAAQRGNGVSLFCQTGIRISG